MPYSPTRPWVDAFADEIEAKLAENRHKGDREGWMKCDPWWLLARLKEEVVELEDAMTPALRCGCRGLSECFHIPHPASPKAHRRECADIGAFAMMIADVAGDMLPKPQQEPPDAR